MKMKGLLKETIKKMPVMKNFFQKNAEMQEKIQWLMEKNQILSNEKIDLRLKIKKMEHKKITVVFVCHRPSVWESLRSVYEELAEDDSFFVHIVAIPNKKELPDVGFFHEEYESEGAEEFWKKYECINGYDYTTREWFDIRSLKPDYVFFQQPYNITRGPLYKSWVVSEYAKICYVAYANNFIGGGILEETSPKDFMQNVFEYYTQNEIDDQLVRNVLDKDGNHFTRTKITGFPRYDNLEQYEGCVSSTWKTASQDNFFRVLWTPRWCVNEGTCSFFEYKDKLVDFFSENRDFEFVFRPHPQAFLNWNRTGEFPEKKARDYLRKYQMSENMSVDQKAEYFKTIFSSDCLISDMSSFIADYFMTGKPVVYCHKKDMFNELSRKMSEGFYWIRSWKELKETLVMLQSGEDPLREKRMELLRELNMRPENGSAAKKIKARILEDAGK